MNNNQAITIADPTENTGFVLDQIIKWDFRHVVRERDRLQRIIDSRPAINAGLLRPAGAGLLWRGRTASAGD